MTEGLNIVIGGLNDATRIQEFTNGSAPSDYTFGGILELMKLIQELLYIVLVIEFHLVEPIPIIRVESWELWLQVCEVTDGLIPFQPLDVGRKKGISKGQIIVQTPFCIRRKKNYQK